MIRLKKNKMAKLLPALIMVFLVLALGQGFAKLTWLLLEKPLSLNEAPVASGSAKPAVQAGSDQAGRDIASWDLFGVLSSDSAATAAVRVQAPDTSLQLTLEGVYVATEAKNSSAIIAEKGNAKRYHVGEEVQQGVSLHEVQSTHVILKRASRFETLRFSDPALQQVPVSEQAPRRVSAAPAGYANKSLVNDIRRGQVRSVQDVLDAYGANPAEQFQRFLQESGMEKTDEGGEPGFKISANVPSDILKTSGLMPGDILRSVNDHPMNELQGNDALLKEVLMSGRAKIVIQRGPRRFVISYPLPQR